MRLLLAACLPSLLAAQAPAGPIQDNSFLVEEAYNQEPGVVQHISTWQRDRRTGAWTAAFTQEWPAPGITHQLSYTLPWLRPEGSRPGLGDAVLNYRYQLLGDGEAALAVAPRLSLVLPTGNVDEGRGLGGPGLQVNVPVSWVLGPQLVSHTNLGATWTRRAEGPDGARADLQAWNAGQSLVWLAHPRFNVLLEWTWQSMESVAGPGHTDRSTVATLSPGVRWSHDFASGLQIVPGVAVPLGVGPSRGERGILLYLSFEHPFGKRPRS